MTNQLVWRMERAEDGLGPFEYGNKLMHSSSLTNEEKDAFNYSVADALGWTQVVTDLGFNDDFQIVKIEHLEIPPDHPHHNRDVVPGGETYVWKVATKDEEQFKHWFPEKSWPFFAERGFSLALYEVPTDYIHFGKYQLLFCFNDAKLVERRPLLP